MTEQQITLNNYATLLLKLRTHVDEAQKNITRQKVVMAWQIGKTLDEHLAENIQQDYDKHLVLQIESDLGIAKSVLYKMRSFYKAYPKLPKDDDKLNWSHYRVLSGVKKEEDRKELENLSRENGWSGDALQTEVAKSKISQIRATSAKREPSGKKLQAKRGQIFSYPLIKQGVAQKLYIDCGFNIFREVEETLPKALKSGDQVVQSFVEGGEYSFKKLPDSNKKMNIYKAELERVIDGDTLHVILDLGFKLTHREILRLRGINAPELSSAAGKKSAKALEKILKDVPFLIVKTTATDVYGRYVCDIFLGEKNRNPQEIADSGIYLNQLLLDQGVAVLF